MHAEIPARIFSFLKSTWVLAALAAALIGGGWYWYANAGKATQQFITVVRGPITEIVSVTGNTAPQESVSLAFGNGGIVESVHASVGDKVVAGETLARLDAADLAAQLKQSEAQIDSAKARLASLQAGAQPEDIAASQAAYDKSVQDLANLYAGISDIARDSYAKADDAVRVQLSSFFSNPDSTQPTLTFDTADSQSAVDARDGRISVGTLLTSWRTAISRLSPASSAADLDPAIDNELAILGQVSKFVSDASSALNASTNLSAAALAANKVAITAATAEVNAAIKNLNAVSQAIASQKLVAAGFKAQLALKKAGATAEDVAVQEAAVAQAEAAAASVSARLRNSAIVAPISGVVTQFDAKAGESVSPAVPLVSIISDSRFRIEADVPEVDVGKVSVGNHASITLDAFPNETFLGTVFYIDPAETVREGVVGYKVKASFDTPDRRLKSGLTANLKIATKHKDDALVLPQYAIVQNDLGAFVRVLDGATATDTPVTLGIQDDKGNVEVMSGVTEGEQVLNVGLKQ